MGQLRFMKALPLSLALASSAGIVFLSVAGCGTRADAPLSSVSGAAPRRATGLTTHEVLAILDDEYAYNPGNAIDDEGTARYRLFEIHCRGGYVPSESDAPLLLEFMRNEATGIDQRLAAAAFLLGLGVPEAQEFVKRQMEGIDGRAVFNALVVAIRYEDFRETEEWRTRLLAGALEHLYPRVLENIKHGRATSQEWPESPSDRAWHDMESYYFDDVCQALGTPEAKSAVPILIRFLEREPFRWGAAQALGLIGDHRAVPVLLSILRNKDVYNPEIVGALARLRARDAVPDLLRILIDGDDYRAAWALGEIGDARAVPVLIEKLSSETACELAVAVIQSLEKIGDTRAAEPLRRISADVTAGPAVRGMSRVALVKFEAEDQATVLIEMLSTENHVDVLRAVVNRLGALGDKKAVEPLFRLSQAEQGAHLRTRIIYALRDIGGREAARRLTDLLSQDFSDPIDGKLDAQFYREITAGALEKATGQKLGIDAEAWKAWLRDSMP